MKKKKKKKKTGVLPTLMDIMVKWRKQVFSPLLPSAEVLRKGKYEVPQEGITWGPNLVSEVKGFPEW